LTNNSQYFAKIQEDIAIVTTEGAEETAAELLNGTEFQ